VPALEPVPGVARVVVTGTSAGRTVANIFHFRRVAQMEESWSSTHLGLLVTDVEAVYKAQFGPCLGSSYSGDIVQAVDLTNVAGLSAEVANTTTGSGGTNTAMPQSIAACVSWKIIRHYRGGHPRTYLGPLPAAAIESPTTLAAAFVTKMQTNSQAFLTAIWAWSTGGANNVELVTVHRQYAKQKLNIPLVSKITGRTVDTRIDSQRRRLGPDR
jgi:hypothetical protein